MSGAQTQVRAVSVAEYKAELRKQKQMPKEKRHLDIHMDYLAENGEQVEREFRFHPTRRWRFDYALPQRKVAVEFDGLYGGGAHTTVGMVAKDSEKINAAQLLGWIVIRVNSSSLRDGSGYRDIDEALRQRTQEATA